MNVNSTVKYILMVMSQSCANFISACQSFYFSSFFPNTWSSVFEKELPHSLTMFSIPGCISSNKCVCGAKYTLIYNIWKQGREFLDFKWLRCQNNTTWPAPKVTESPESTVLSWESIWLFTGWWVCSIFDHICLILLGRTNSADAISACERCPCLFFRLFFAKSQHVSARGFRLLGLSFILVLSGLSLRAAFRLSPWCWKNSVSPGPFCFPPVALCEICHEQ